MPLIYPVSVVSFSSEDPNHPASNLKSKDTYRKWRCKEAGEKEAFVILKFEKAVQFTGIDVGNECSAMLEIHVGRSGGEGEVKWEVLLSSSALMTPVDSRNLNNPCAVKSYNVNHFDRETASEKWDLVKVVVTQLFNRTTQFGLSFIKFTAPGPDPELDVTKKIGWFAVKKSMGEEEDEDEEIDEPRIGAMFAKTLAKVKKNATEEEKEQKPNSNSANSVIRDISTSISGAAQSSSEKLVKDVLMKHKVDVSIPNMPAEDVSSLPSSSSQSTKKYKKDDLSSTSAGSSPSSGRQSQSSNGNKNITASASPSSRMVTPSTSRKRSQNGSTSKKKSIRKPFNKLFEDVVFVMSGFENPYRGSLRNKLVEMGAKCKPDWNHSCTHLICAFTNTPKFREVRASGHGNIVTKEWVERSYAVRKRFPWRRFCLDRNDRGEESEEEILAEEDDEEEEEEIQDDSDESSGPSYLSGGRMDSNKDEEREASEDEDEIVGPKSKKRKRVLPVEDSEDENNEGEGKDDETIFEEDTDVDDEDPKRKDYSSQSVTHSSQERSGNGESSAPDFEEPDPQGADGFFENSVFFLSLPSGSGEKYRIEQIISRRKGKVVKELTAEVEYLVTNEQDWNEEFSEALSENPNLSVVNLDWIQKCENASTKIPCDEFIITPM